ncbi:ribbon-helix-helix domain-containing protein [Candidatus Woesearchaeota archaeon]|nr:ribbon-helix-helix domain-containing protein [Candidatus Woesearchaeota archaeon]
MATEMITVKMDKKFLQELDTTVKKNGYQNRTEFIRNALREKMDEMKLKQAMMELAHRKGASKKKTTNAELERIREKVFNELARRVR